MSVRVTVAIPVFNSASTLERAVRSVMRQTVREIEILITDDASTDGSAAVAAGLAAEDRRITVLRSGVNGGKPRAMNRMVAAANGEWIAVLDADDAYREDRLERLLDAAAGRSVNMIADNILYVEAGVDAGPDTGVDQVMQAAFPPGSPARSLTRYDLAAHSDSFAAFDFGILKPVMRRSFLQDNQIRYYEDNRLSEDFYYLMHFFAAGGTGLLLSEPMYSWTVPFGAVSRQWTQTQTRAGTGTGRYDYRQVLRANEYFIGEMRAQGQADMVRMLVARSGQYRAMISYLDAQRLAFEGGWIGAASMIARHPETWRLLTGQITGRITGRIRRSLVPRPAPSTLPTHPT